MYLIAPSILAADFTRLGAEVVDVLAAGADWVHFDVMDKIDLVLLMSVNPGFGGQQFIPLTLAKLRAARARIDAYQNESGRKIRLEIDGGVKVENIAEIARAGADTFVIGSAIYGAGKASDARRYDSVIAALRAELAKV